MRNPPGCATTFRARALAPIFRWDPPETALQRRRLARDWRARPRANVRPDAATAATVSLAPARALDAEGIAGERSHGGEIAFTDAQIRQRRQSVRLEYRVGR